MFQLSGVHRSKLVCGILSFSAGLTASFFVRSGVDFATVWRRDRDAVAAMMQQFKNHHPPSLVEEFGAHSQIVWPVFHVIV